MYSHTFTHTIYGFGGWIKSLQTHFLCVTHSEEKEVGFEDHVLLDHLLQGFPTKGTFIV